MADVNSDDYYTVPSSTPHGSTLWAPSLECPAHATASVRCDGPNHAHRLPVPLRPCFRPAIQPLLQVLGVSRQATDKEISNAYKKQALRWCCRFNAESCEGVRTGVKPDTWH